MHQIIKDFNINAIQDISTGYTSYGCIVSGCTLELTSGPPYYIQINSGVLLFNTNASEDYDGSLVEIPTTSFSPAVTVPPSGSTDYWLDISYTEVVDPATESRYRFDVASSTIQGFSASTSTLPGLDFSLNSSASPAAGYVRFAKVTVNDDATIDPPVYELPRIWELDGWPGASSHTFDSTKTQTLADSLSSIRAELKAILGSGSNWYDAPASSLATLNTDMAAIESTINAISATSRSCIVYKYTENSLTPFIVPAGIKTLRARLWGQGGKAGSSNAVYLGGRGGSGAYIEEVMTVTPGQSISFYVGHSGDGSQATVFGTLTAGAGGDGTDAVFNTGVDGADGTVSGGTFISLTGDNGAIYRKYPNASIAGQDSRHLTSAKYGLVGSGGMWNFNAPGSSGLPGLIMVSWE